MVSKTLRRLALGFLLAVAAVTPLALPAGGAGALGAEVELSSDQFARLDTFESHTLGRADEIFGAGDYRRAGAEYEAFLVEFPRSSAAPYALLRKGRSLHLDGKRFEAIKVYNQVLDYFPQRVQFAAAALYHLGQCHAQNGEPAEAMRAWAEMAEDEDYRTHVLAAQALIHLAEYYAKQNQPDQALRYYRQAAVDFRTTNPQPARQAIEQVLAHHVRTAPDEPALRTFYQDVAGLDVQPRELPPDLLADRAYWKHLRDLIKRHGSFTAQQRPLEEAYYRYWARRMEGRFLDWDDFQIDYIQFMFRVEQDPARWISRLDQQYARLQKEGDHARTLRWMQLLAGHPEKVEAYYQKLDFAKMTSAQITSLMQLFFDGMKDPERARNTFEKLRLAEMSDDEKQGLTGYLWGRDSELVERVCAAYHDGERGRYRYFEHLHWRYRTQAAQRTSQLYGEALALAEELAGSPRFAQDTLWKKAELHETAGEHEKAIQAYQLADNPPANLFRIAACYRALDRLEAAVGQLHEIENFFPDQGPQAALLIAHYYRDANVKPQQIAALRAIMKKYPKSPQSSQAHLELERLGVAIGGGTDAE